MTNSADAALFVNTCQPLKTYNAPFERGLLAQWSMKTSIDYVTGNPWNCLSVSVSVVEWIYVVLHGSKSKEPVMG